MGKCSAFAHGATGSLQNYGFKDIFMPEMLHFLNLYGTIIYRTGISNWSKILQLCFVPVYLPAQKLACAQGEEMVEIDILSKLFKWVQRDG